MQPGSGNLYPDVPSSFSLGILGVGRRPPGKVSVNEENNALTCLSRRRDDNKICSSSIMHYVDTGYRGMCDDIGLTENDFPFVFYGIVTI